MGDKTHISWSDATWNPISGCSKVSDGCLNCYIDRTPPFRMNGRKFNGRGIGATTGVKLHSDRLSIPIRWAKPRMIFVCSLADLFQDEVPNRFIADVFAVMSIAGHHIFQVLTKRHGRMRSLLNSPGFWMLVDAARSARGFDKLPGGAPHVLPNVWVGVSTENQQWADLRIPALLDTPAAVRWISAEPLLGPIDLTRTDKDALVDGGLDWVVVGGESGPGARPMHPAWASSLRDQCLNAGVAYHFKQWGEWSPIQDPFDYVTNDDRVQVVSTAGERLGRPWRGWKVQDRTRDAEPMRRYGKKAAGRELDGRTWDEYPRTLAGATR